ncbi:hypothetical protein RD792_006223 [Penstemon davidsonii]|uniref:DEAD-box ATP-dependent RNA helicase 50 n=1 Tax=Penstemon davidsonii TaxID=160366 RepID=A0ABR0DD00_9LAMI|nr:hypothetical protein RD792_006223 [Penstemon davidsonii]
MARVILTNPSAFSLSGRRGYIKHPTTSFTRPLVVCDAGRHLSVDEARGGGTSRSFGRLKVRRVRDIVNESYRKKKQGNDLEDDEEKPEFKTSVVPVESHDESDMLHDRKDLSAKKDTPKAVRGNTHSAGRVVSSSRVSAGSSKGWHNVEPTNSYRPKTNDISRKGQDVKADGDFFSRKSFKEVGCSDYVTESLRKLQYLRPSHIQAMTFAPVLGGKSCIMADYSGSGKTLAYLIPLVQRLRQEELDGLGRPASQSPRVVILVPTAELASQDLENVVLARHQPYLYVMTFLGFSKLSAYLCCFPIVSLVRAKLLAVLDEVDILFNDEDFELALQMLVNSAPVTTQYLFVTATLPVEIYNKLVEDFPDCEVIMGPGVHRTSHGLEEILIDCSGDDTTERSPDTAFLNKKNALLQLVEQSPVTKTIVFCNKIDTCRKVENALKRFDRKEISTKILPFHAALEQESRLANIKEFRSLPPKNIAMFLVCTDRASRGIDFAGVDHVVLFDFPRDPSEYVRRVGRTARGAGGRGKAFIFVVVYEGGEMGKGWGKKTPAFPPGCWDVLHGRVQGEMGRAG